MYCTKNLVHAFVSESNEIHVTASLGVAFYPKYGGDVETLVKKADIAMPRAEERPHEHYWHYTEGFGRSHHDGG